jgi:streptogrisin C
MRARKVLYPAAAPAVAVVATGAPAAAHGTSPAPAGTLPTDGAGDTVTSGGATCRCPPGRTAIARWVPPNVPALWRRV